MADDWESAADAAATTEPAIPSLAPKPAAAAAGNKWADEDAPEPEVEAPIQKGPAPAVKKKALSAAKLAKKEIEDVRKAEAEAKARAKDPKLALAHKQAMQKLAEEGDKEIAESLFAGAGDDAPKREKRVQPDVLKQLELKTAQQYDQFAKDVANKMLPNDAEKTKRDAIGFVKSFLKFAAAKGLDSDNLRELSSAMTVVLNEKIKEEGSSKKKKGAKATAKPALKTLNSNANKSTVDEQTAAASDNTDEYDFL